MDGRQPGAWMQTIGIAPSRRVLLAGIAGAALSGLLAARADSAAAAPATPTAPRKQKRLANLSVLKAGLKWIESRLDENGAYLGSDGKPEAGVTAAVVTLLIALRNIGIDAD